MNFLHLRNRTFNIVVFNLDFQFFEFPLQISYGHDLFVVFSLTYLGI